MHTEYCAVNALNVCTLYTVRVVCFRFVMYDIQYNGLTHGVSLLTDIINSVRGCN